MNDRLRLLAETRAALDVAKAKRDQLAREYNARPEVIQANTECVAYTVDIANMEEQLRCDALRQYSADGRPITFTWPADKETPDE